MPRLVFFALSWAILLVGCSGPSRPTSPEPLPPSAAVYPEAQLDADVLEAHLRFLASDELMGRKAGTMGNNVAARYLAVQFRAAGLAPVPGADGYFQSIPFTRTTPPVRGTLRWEGETFEQGGALLLIAGDTAAERTAPTVFAGYGLSADDYAGRDASGKIVVTQAGRPGDTGVQAAFRATPEKRALAAEQGAVALVEIYQSPFPWKNLVSVLGTPRFGLDAPDPDAPSLPVAWLNEPEGTLLKALQQGAMPELALVSSGMNRQAAASNNVAAYVPGSDPALRDEYLVLMAHYDHVGAGLRSGPGATPADSIFNGARDNGMGTVALLGAAEAFAAAPPRRSVLFLALTAEEDGLLGSRYYVNNPLLPLDQMVFALNIDGGGYSDTSLVTVIGLGRTTADALIEQGAAAYGLDVIADPAPEQNLFDRSDNVNFARKGIPAPTFSLGFRAFSDPGVAQYYHRPQDEADSIDYAYLHRFVQAYTHAARLIADAPERPRWRPGDKYEEAARALYGSE